MTYEFVFRHLTPQDERAALLLETEVPILRQVADECERALDELSLEQADERPGVIDAHIAQLRSRLGLAAFSSLDSHIYRTFEGDAGDSGSSTPPSRAPRSDQLLEFPLLPSKVHRDPDFTLHASSTSGLPVVVASHGKCTVYEGHIRTLGAGTCHLSLHQPGSSSFLAAPITEQEFTIAKAEQTISVPDFSNPPYGPASLRLDVSASSGLPFTISTAGTCERFGSHLEVFGSGTCTFTATQAGNQDFFPAPPVTRTFEVFWSEPVY